MYFRDIAGHALIKEKLIQNARTGRISHAQLFLGPEGSGKLAMAIAFARFLSCKQPGPEDACGKCGSCLKYNKLAHPDLNFFFPIASKKQGEKTYSSKDYISNWREYLQLSNYVSLNSWYEFLGMENKQGIINAEDCNEVIRVLSYKSYESPFKVVIMWMIERLYHAAAPKLLKILEEPPEGTLFLLMSENQEQVLNTILSRAQIVKIPALTEEEVENGLVDLYQHPRDVAETIAFLADGNFYKALALARNDESHDTHTRFLREWLRHCYSYKPEDILKFVEEMAKMGREAQKTLLGFGLEIFRQCTLVNYHAGMLVKTNEETHDFVVKFSKVLKPDVALLLSEEFSKAIYHVERNANPKILFTDLSLTLSRIFMDAKK